jgi:hypothetical protein
MLPKTLSRTVMILVAILTLAGLVLAPAAPAAAVDLGFDVRYTGVIETVGTDTQAWVIGGQKLATDSSTMIRLLEEPAVPGLWADVAAKKQADNSLLAKQITVRKEQVRLDGVLSAKPADGNAGVWVIAGVNVNVTADTKISTRAGDIAVGNWVEAVMTEDKGVLTADQILPIGEQDAVVVTGMIQEVTDTYWVLSGIKLFLKAESSAGANDGTLISGKPVVGVIAHGAADLQEDNTLLARGLRVGWIDNNQLVPATDFTGKVTAITTAKLLKTLTVETTDPAMTYTVVVMPNSRVHQEKGLLVVGSTVHVTGWQYATGQVIGSEITVISSPQDGGEFKTFGGEIKSLPASGTTGEWMVGTQKVIVDDQTQMTGSAPKVGAWAVGGGIKRADGSILAQRVTVFAPRIVTVTPPPFPWPTRTPRP